MYELANSYIMIRPKTILAKAKSEEARGMEVESNIHRSFQLQRTMI